MKNRLRKMRGLTKEVVFSSRKMKKRININVLVMLQTHCITFSDVFFSFKALAKADQAKISADESSSKVGGALDTVNDILRQLGK